MNDAAPSDYQGFKIWISHILPVDRDLLHIALGALILCALLIFVRPKIRAVMVGAVVAAMAGFAMEALDLRDAWNSGSRLDWAHSAADVMRTVLVPTGALLVTGLAGRRAC